MKTLYITDLDGTLLNTEDKINDYSATIINDLVAKGALITYATGRSLSSASLVAKNLTLNIPVITYNGCTIVSSTTGEVIDSNIFSIEERNTAINIIKKSNVSPLVYSHVNGIEKVSYIPEKLNDGGKRYLSVREGDKRLNPVENEDMLYLGDIFYFNCIDDQKPLLPIFNAFQAYENYNCTLQQELYRDEFWCEIMPVKATKANAILKLKALLGCDRIVSFGDAINDISMFTISGECYAVESAVPELKDIANGIICNSNDDGVAKWLNENVKI